MRRDTAIPPVQHAPSVKHKNRPLWRRRLVLAGAACLLLAAVALRIGSQRNRLACGLVIATPEIYEVGWRASRAGISLYYEKGECYGVALSERRLDLCGCSVQRR